MSAPLFHRQGGAGDPLLVLLHGLGASGGVWLPMLRDAERRWPGRWIMFDLPGHGASAPLFRYGNQDYAAVLGPAIADAANGAPVTLLGHSLGGTIALALASGAFGFRPAQAFALGIKIDWSCDEMARFANIASRPPRLFESEAAALGQHAKYAGIDAPTDSPLLENGAQRVGRQWRAAVDLAAFALEQPDMEQLYAEARCATRLARGSADQMVTLHRLRDFDANASDISDAGHNAMVDQPTTLWSWIGE